MRTNLSTRLACLALIVSFALALGLRVTGQTVLPAPSVTFSLPNGSTVYKSSGLVEISASAFYAPGLRSLSLSGGWSGSSAYYPPGYSTASTRLYFYASYYPVGDYTIKATATGDDGKQTAQSILVHVK